MALPEALRTLRLRDQSVGTISLPSTPNRNLHGVGLAACQTGWTLQGLYLDDEGALVTTSPITIGLAEVPTGRAIRYTDPALADRAYLLDFKAFGYDRVSGRVRVLDTSNDDAVVLEMNVDGTPSSLLRAPGLGPAGCFDTGFWKASKGEETTFGPALGIYDPANLHYVGLRLNPTVNLVLLFTLKASERGRNDVINTSFEKIRENPELVPIRGYLERRVNADAPADATGPLIELQEYPIERGKIVAAFPTGDVAGPMRIAIEGIVLPTWDGPGSGATFDKIRAEVLFVTDTEGEEVPLPSQPDWFERPPVVLP